MQIYGASPIYKFVEHVFRFRWLFAVWIALAEVGSCWLAFNQTGTYTARALIMLDARPDPSGTHTVGAAGATRSRYSLLAAFQRDPDFMKRALRSAIAAQGHRVRDGHKDSAGAAEIATTHFSATLREGALESLARRAAQSLTVTEKGGAVEISCRWPDPLAADIVRAFCQEFHATAMDYETAGARLQEDLLTRLLENHKATQHRVEEKLLSHQRRQGLEAPDATPGDVAGYPALMRELDALQASIVQLRERRDAYATQLKTMPTTIKASEVFGKPMDTPLYQAAVRRSSEAQAALDALKAKYQDTHPKVQEAQQALDAAEARMRSAETANRATPNLQQTTSVPNSEFTRITSIVSQATADLKGMMATLALKQKQADAQRQRALAAAPGANELKWLMNQRDTLRTTRAGLEAKLEAAAFAHRQQVARASLETGMMVKPVAVSEETSGRALAVCIFAPMFGFLTALALSGLAGGTDHSLHTPQDVQKRLGKPAMAVLTRVESASGGRRQLSSGAVQPHKALPPA